MKTFFFLVLELIFFMLKKPAKVIVFCLIECLLHRTFCPTVIITCPTVFLSSQTFCLVPEKKYFKPCYDNKKLPRGNYVSHSLK